jgi:seryl-tRNA synthetase
MTTYDVKEFYDGLVAHGHLVPAGPLGAFGRGPVFEDVLQRFDGLVVALAKDDGVETVTFPPVIDRMIIEKTGYMDSFPTLCGAIHSFTGTEKEARALSARIAEGHSWGEALGQTDVVMNPAACYPFYPTCRGTLPANGRHVTMQAWVYRQEPSLEPTRMRSFRVREFIRVGAPDMVVKWRDQWLDRGVTLLTALEMPARADVAADPFFGRGGKILAAGQLEQKLKFEVLIPVISEKDPTACCSFNYHQDKFGSAFDIKLPNGETAHSACLGFGLERVVMALFKTHGFDVKAWPKATRARLWP